MGRDASRDDAPTRRDYLKYGGAVVGGGLLAGCAGGTVPESNPDTTAMETETATKTSSETDATTETSSPEDDPYTVSMVPVGEVTFESVPETWVANNGSWADMGIALGLEPPKGVWLTSRYHTHYDDEIPGVSVDEDRLTELRETYIEQAFETRVSDEEIEDRSHRGLRRLVEGIGTERILDAVDDATIREYARESVTCNHE